MSQIIPENLLDALTTYIRLTEGTINRKYLSNLKTALKIYILPNLAKYSFTEDDLKDSEDCLEEVSLEDFMAAQPLEILAAACKAAAESGMLKPDVERTTYRPAMAKFIAWIEEQDWFVERNDPNAHQYAPKKRYGKAIHRANKGNRCYHESPYSLKEDELTAELKQQISGLHDFCTGKYVPKRQDKPMREVTFKKHRLNALLFMGWLKNIQGYAIEDLDLKRILDIDLLNQFFSWGINERKNTSGWASAFCDLALNVAKWLNAARSKQPMYRDIPVVEEIRMINNTLRQQYEEEKKARKRAKLPEKEMTLEQCQAVVEYLRKCCAPKDSYGGIRGDIAVGRDYQHYLLIAILTYCPIRQREIRELQFGKTIHRTPNGYRVTLKPEDNKTGDERDFMLSDVLPPDVNADLNYWVDFWLPRFQEATQNMNNWLGFIGRREYKSEAELNEYIIQLPAKIQEAEENGFDKQVKKLEKALLSAPRNFQSQAEAKKNFQEGLLFISLGDNQYNRFGKELSASGLGNIVRTAVFSATASLVNLGHPLFEGVDPKETNPHFFRNIAITHERRHGDPSKRKDFHKMIGNSERVGDRDYNEMHPEEKTVNAKDWWKTENGKGRKSPFNQIQKLIPKLTLEERYEIIQLLNNYSS